ncbi:MAG: HNH endonuclease [Rhodospirillales bacterium]
MSYCVFMVRPDSIYDDYPTERYQFPKQYIGRTQGVVGDWIVYLEPTKVRNSRGYFAIACVQEIIEDPASPDMHLAIIVPGSYLEFAKPVPFSDQDGPIEKGLLNEQGRLSGRAQAAVRPISANDFLKILEHGLDESSSVLPRFDELELPGLSEEQTPFIFETDRQRVHQLTNRVVRDRVFRRIVLRAYDERCAISGLKFINGGGRAEVDAAHIRPVQKNGPDVIQNGIALSGTAHWMFDRGLISLTNEFEILISRHVNDIDGVKAFINRSNKAIVPDRISDRPHPRFLEWHRDFCFET